MLTVDQSRIKADRQQEPTGASRSQQKHGLLDQTRGNIRHEKSGSPGSIATLGILRAVVLISIVVVHRAFRAESPLEGYLPYSLRYGGRVGAADPANPANNL